MEDVLKGIELLKNAESVLLKNYDMLTDDFVEVCEMNEKLKHELAELKDDFVKVSEMIKSNKIERSVVWAAVFFNS